MPLIEEPKKFIVKNNNYNNNNNVNNNNYNKTSIPVITISDNDCLQFAKPAPRTPKSNTIAAIANNNNINNTSVTYTSSNISYVNDNIDNTGFFDWRIDLFSFC